MADSTNLDAVLLGGKLALAGAAIPAIFVFVDHWRERIHRSREVLRAKYEELASAVDDTVVWFYALDACTSNQDIVATHPSKAGRRIASLAMVYFPKIREEALSYSNALIDYYQWRANLTEMSGVPLGLATANHPELQEKIDEVDAHRNALEAAITKYAPNYTSA